MSARAAWRLESFGFGRVFRYTPGKADWFASGLPREGEFAAVPRVGDAARRDAPTCGLDERVGEVRERVRAAGWTSCVVVNQERVVLGLVRTRGLDGDPTVPVEAVMHAAPRTYRPNVLFERPLDYMREHRLDSVLVTTSDGVLVGALRREDAERYA
jgi:CBS domain-containing protein